MRVFAGMNGEMRKAGTLNGVLSVEIFYNMREKIDLPDAQASEVIADLVTLGCASEGNVILRLGHVQWGRDMIGEATVLVKIDNQEAEEYVLVSSKLDKSSIRRDDLRIAPVLGPTESIVQVLDHLLTRCHGTGWVHRVNGAALGVDVRERGQSTLFQIAVELVRVGEVIHRVVLNPL